MSPPGTDQGRYHHQGNIACDNCHKQNNRYMYLLVCQAKHMVTLLNEYNDVSDQKMKHNFFLISFVKHSSMLFRRLKWSKVYIEMS